METAQIDKELERAADGRVIFTKEMRRSYTILAPNMAPIHFKMIERVFLKHGYNFEILRTTNDNIAREGLQSVHNDTCYPALLVVGQFIDALKSGKYDPHKTAVMITQTGGGCRASNYIFLIRKALARSGFGYVPVISLNGLGMEKNPGFKPNVSLMLEMLYAVEYGDALMLLSNQTRPYEVEKGRTDALIDEWVARLDGRLHEFVRVKHNLKKMVREFDAIPVSGDRKIRVGIVGEIYMKYAPLGNNNLESKLAQEDVEVVVPSLMDYLLYCMNHRIEDKTEIGIKNPVMDAAKYIGEKYLMRLQELLISTVKKLSRFDPPARFHETKKLIKGFISAANKMGEGWLLTAEMLELIHSGVPNIVCTQPFGCLPNHIAGKGMIRAINRAFPQANIVAIDFDPGATKINQENRLKLMLALARENAAAAVKEHEETQHVYVKAPAATL